MRKIITAVSLKFTYSNIENIFFSLTLNCCLLLVLFFFIFLEKKKLFTFISLFLKILWIDSAHFKNRWTKSKQQQNENQLDSIDQRNLIHFVFQRYQLTTKI